jgi:hypothetical protein
MAKPQKKLEKKVEWKGYLRVNLTDEQEKHFDEWLPLQDIKISDFGILCNNGFKISLGWDRFNDGVVASLFANDVRLAWAGWILTAWAASSEEAVALLFYKHYIVCEEDWERFYDVVEKSHRKRG